MLLLFIPIVLIALQWIGYHLAQKKADARYRWWTFWGTMLLYYLILFIAYNRAAAYYDGRRQCGMWTIGYFILGIIGLSMPLTQLIFTVKDTIRRRRFSKIEVEE